ncbi:MAG: 1-propanol dehydrogenase PduQ [Enterobacteriaceae bacterium]
MDSFVVKTKICFGTDSLDFLAGLQGSTAMIITDNVMVELGFAERVCARLRTRNIGYHIFYAEEACAADMATIVAGVQQMERISPDIVIALGGGTSMDAAKAMLYTMWCINKKTGVTQATRPCFIAIPTTSGTGSEVTSFSVVTAKSDKLVLVDEWMLPDVAILDPQLVNTLPAAIVADTGMDVLAHALEAYVSTGANDFTDALAEKAIQLIFRYLLDSYRDNNDIKAKEKIHNAATIAGMAFTNAQLGICHSLSHALTSRFGTAHGRANALLLPYVIEFNSGIQTGTTCPSAKKYAELARILGLPCQTEREGVLSLITAVQVLKEEMAIPGSIRDSGIAEQHFTDQLYNMATLAIQDSCTPANPRASSESELIAIYRDAYTGRQFA